MPAIAADSPIHSPRVADPTPSPTSDSAQPRSLSEAVAAVTEHNLCTEMRRVRHAYASSLARADGGTITLPRAEFDAMHKRLREIGVLQRVLAGGPLRLIAFDAEPPHRVRELPTSLSGDAAANAALSGQPLAQCFIATDALRVQRALLALDSDLTMTVEWRGAGATGSQRHLLHLLPPDSTQPDIRWACLLRMPTDPYAAERSTRRTLTKPSLRPRPEAWPLQSL